MTEESGIDEAEIEEEPVEKLLIDRPADFRFHAAYLIYSQAWDKSSSPEIKRKLNDIIESLSKGKTDYDRFYQEIHQYRAEFNPEHFTHGQRRRIETQRKRDWRRKEKKSLRNTRHRR